MHFGHINPQVSTVKKQCGEVECVGWRKKKVLATLSFIKCPAQGRDPLLFFFDKGLSAGEALEVKKIVNTGETGQEPDKPVEGVSPERRVGK